MNVVELVNDCYGCGVCAISCPKKIISMALNENGFYSPLIKKYEACISCGICTEVCSFINEFGEVKPLAMYAAWSNDENSRLASTSGGVAFEVSKKLVSEGFEFCGVRYNADKNRVEHYITSSVEGLKQSRGSKYLPSYTLDAFKCINRTKTNVIVGTPCQIASLRRYVNKFRCSDNFVLIDFFCHGVPSMLMWNKYLDIMNIGIGKLKDVTWRNKIKGWGSKSYCISLIGSDGTIHSWNGKDDFYTMFLGDACLSKACYGNCKFKNHNSSADIRIGDFWSDVFKNEEKGVNLVLTFSKKGDLILKESNVFLKELPFNTDTGQMKKCAKIPWYYSITMYIIKKANGNIRYIIPIIRFQKRLKGHVNRIKMLLK